MVGTVHSSSLTVRDGLTSTGDYPGCGAWPSGGIKAPAW